MMYLLTLLLALLAAGEARAVTLYVDGATGDDTRSYATAQNPATPWQTIGRAAWGDETRSTPNAGQAAAAGDTVLIAAGIYTTVGYTLNDSAARFQVALGPANSGTAGNLITFRGVGEVEIRSAGAGNYGPLIGSNGKNYIAWRNIFLNGQYSSDVSDTGTVVLNNCTGCEATQLRVWGHNGSYASGLLHQNSGNVYSSGSTVTGVSTSFTLQLAVGDQIAAGKGNYYAGETSYPVASIGSSTSLTVTGTPNWNDQLSGTVTSVGTAVTGVGTAFTTELEVGDRISGTASTHYTAGLATYVVQSIASDTALTLASTPSPTWTALNLIRRLNIFAPRYSQNYNLIRLEACTSCVVSNNYLYRAWGYGTTADSGDHNDAGVMTYRAVDTIIEHNECEDVGVCVILKGVSSAESEQSNVTVRYNYAHDVTWCYRIMLAQDVRLYQNICDSPKQWGIAFGYDGSGIPTAATRAQIVNNTIRNQRTANYAALFPEGIKMVDVVVQNNILHTAYAMYGTLVNADPSAQDFSANYNFFYSPITAHARLNTDGSPANMNFATWQGSPNLKDITSGNGTDPLFVNASGTYSLATDLKLQVGSTARNFGIDVLDLDGDSSVVDAIHAGAYITGNETIGIESTVGSVGVSGTVGFSGTVRLQ